jgi:hypothetical protein
VVADSQMVGAHVIGERKGLTNQTMIFLAQLKPELRTRLVRYGRLWHLSTCCVIYMLRFYFTTIERGEQMVCFQSPKKECWCIL